MKNSWQIGTSILFTFFLAQQGMGQGCSDAGACSIESFTPTSAATELRNEVNLGVNGGAADHNIFVIGTQVGYTRKIGSSFSIDTRLTYLAQSGNDISESGLGDVYLMANYNPSAILTISGGVKIPTNKADKALDGIALPMDYQSSLGTLDLIVGIAFRQSDWLFALGYQHPLQQNENAFDPNQWTGPLSEFRYTAGFERQPDFLLRVSRILHLNDKITFSPGILPIYHLADDKAVFMGETFSIEGSAGLTLNANLHTAIQLSEKSKLGINIGFPLIVREERPDGLTRSFVAGLEYGIMF